MVRGQSFAVYPWFQVSSDAVTAYVIRELVRGLAVKHQQLAIAVLSSNAAQCFHAVGPPMYWGGEEKM